MTMHTLCEVNGVLRNLGEGNHHTCRTCRHWDQCYPENAGLGRCLRVSTITFEAFRGEPAAIALSVPPGMRECNPPSREEAYPVLRTVIDFGCIGWERKADLP